MDAYPRSVRFWLRAYPRRWRVERGDELVAVLTDLAPPTARRVDARTAVDLVRGGWATRARLHPPLGHWLAYRVLGRRIRPAYRGWARDDIDGRWFPLRRTFPGTVPFLVLLVLDLATPATTLWRPEWWLTLFGLALVSSVATARSERARAVEQHLTLDPGDLVVPGATVRTLGPRRRLEARSALGWTVAALVVLAAAATTAVSLAPLGWAVLAEPVTGGVNVETVTAPMGAARTPILISFATTAAIGVVLALVGWHRTRRALPGVPVQPHRTLAPLARSAGTVVSFVVALAVVVAANEATGATALWLSPVIGAGAFLALPPATVLLLAARHRAASHRAAPRTAQDLAARDLWLMALRGRPPVVEQPVLAPRRVTGPVPAGAVAPSLQRPDPQYPAYRSPPIPGASPYTVPDERPRRRPSAS